MRYWVLDRIHCRWVETWGTVQQWAALPHVTMPAGCKVGIGLAALSGLGVAGGMALGSAIAPAAMPNPLDALPGPFWPVSAPISFAPPLVPGGDIPVPEPTTWALLAAGVVVLALVRQLR